ncbi:hypothetical protein LHYA1_G004671 [Lachnellula hyalina]|uniref:Uncharacterized protein n=1 Tax=Lachnellula hyalina TaxID=1316788 RepID=A0A8H8R3W7_9HELO|nr:uncharacterized protein LHYA1_G004671 [Lachnellula hyalina]TVY27171.1 hypothetical protein LHYA1_G004671 [Lachnellula hyalina]
MGENESVSLGANTPPAQTRSPLLPRNLSPPAIPVRRIRRKTSFVLRSDSDDNISTSHDSIFEASCLSGSDENWNGIALATLSETKPSTGERKNDENARERVTHPTRTSVQDVEFRYGRGTVLVPIKEQTSYTTIGSLARSKSVNDMTKFPFLTHRDSFTVAKSPRCKQSFSLDDIARTQEPYHDACAIIEGALTTSIAIHEVYAEPKAPLHAPLQRRPTPPGMPSWTGGQNIPPRPRQSAPQQSRLQRFLGLPASFTLSSRMPRHCPNNGTRSVSAPVNRRVPVFRPPRSVYGHIVQHPFNNAPVAAVQQRTTHVTSSENTSRLRKQHRLGQQVRFTPSATARDSEMNTLRNAIESTSTSALHPMAIGPIPMEAIPNSPQVPSTRKCPHGKNRKARLEGLHHGVNSQNAAPANTENMSSLSPTRLNPANIITPTSSPTSSPSGPNSVASSPRVSTAAEFGVTGEWSSRPISASSTTQLLAGTVPSPRTAMLGSPNPTSRGSSKRPSLARNANIKIDDSRCWRCHFVKAAEKLDQWWERSTDLFCFICCGFEADEEMGMHGFDGPSDLVGPRRIILDSTPAVAL